MKTAWKDIPVFISSTFNDMHAERDYLVKFVFPELADWCARRKLRLNDIDLRWGITAEDSRTKRTLGICLRDIDESSPSVQAADKDLWLFRRKLEEKADFLRHYQSDWNPQLPSPELGGMEAEEGQGRLTNFRVGDTPLKEIVIDCLKKAILEEYPERAEEIDESSEEEARLFFEERMAEGYIEQPEVIKALEQYLEGPDRNIMVLYAPSGRGKTTLLCALARRLRKKGGMRVLLRSCGSGQDTSSVLGVFDSILRQLSVTPPLVLAPGRRMRSPRKLSPAGEALTTGP